MDFQILVFIILVINCITKIESLLCYNGTFTNRKFGQDPIYGGVFTTNQRIIKLRCSLTVFCPDNAMCFVRSWSARARHSWIVQRGCYQPSNDDPLPRSMTTPTRAMTCKNDRLADAEYSVCLCKADWCNSASRIQPYNFGSLLKIMKPVITYVNNVYRYIILIN